jgi:hypothetical protein
MSRATKTMPNEHPIIAPKKNKNMPLLLDKVDFIEFYCKFYASQKKY